MKMRIKICGITRVTDAKIAAQAGVDAIDLVFYEKSPRVVTIPQAQGIMAALPAFVSTVALFVNADASASTSSGPADPGGLSAIPW